MQVLKIVIWSIGFIVLTLAYLEEITFALLGVLIVAISTGLLVYLRKKYPE